MKKTVRVIATSPDGVLKRQKPNQSASLFYYNTKRTGAQEEREEKMNDFSTGALPRMRTIKAAAAECGLSEYFVRQLVKAHKIIYVCAGCKYLINLDSLVQYLNNGEGAAE